MDRWIGSSSSGLAVGLLLCAAWLSACSDPQSCGCGEPDMVCASSSDAGVEALYEFTPEDVREIAQGTWTGRYFGGDAADPFDVTVTVAELDPAMYSYADDGVQRYQPRALREDVEIDEEFRRGCVSMAVPALVHVEASDPVFTLDRDLRHVSVFGTSLLRGPFDGSTNDVEHPPGVATAGSEVNGPHFEIEYWFVFGTDARLWMSVERDGMPAKYVESGRRQ